MSLPLPLSSFFSVPLLAWWWFFVLSPPQTGGPPVAENVLRPEDNTISRHEQEPPETTLVFPDYVDGGGWSVQLVLSNIDPDAAAEVRVEVYDPDGEPVRGLFDADARLEIPPLGSRVLRSAGAGAIRRGWIQVETGAGAVSGLLTYRHAESGIEVGVDAVDLGSRFALFVEESPTVGAGVAVFKPDEATRLELRIRGEEGNDPLAGGFVPWGDFHQAARTLPEWFSAEGIDRGFLGDFRGLLLLQTEDESGFAPLGLRFGKGTSSLSAVPAVRTGSRDPRETDLIFPDYVDGGGWSVQLALSNVDPDAAAGVRVEVYDPEGAPVGDLFDSDSRLEIPALGSRVLRSGGGGDLRRGWIQVRTGAAGVTGLLTYRQGETGVEVSVEPVQWGHRFALFVEESETIGAGLALLKPEARSRVELRLRDEEGNDPLVGAFVPWADFHQAARTLPEWFAAEGIDGGFLEDFRGLLFLRTEEESGFAPLGLRFGKGTSSLSAVPAIRIPDGRGIDVGPAPTVTLSASPTSIERGESTTLTWSSTNAESAEMEPDIGEVAVSGTRRVSPEVTTTYRITVRGADGQTATAAVTVSVAISEQRGMTVLGKVTALPAGDVVHRPARFFDLEGRTVTFTPDGEGRYAVRTGSLTWVETNASTGPVFDLSTGSHLGRSAEVSLPFDFPFAGRMWTRVHANTNGNVSFAAPETTHMEQRDIWSDGRMRSVAAAVDSRSATGFEAMLAVLWAIYGEAVVSVAASPERVAITWDAVRTIPRTHFYEPAGRNEFQVRIYPSGVIELAYRQVSERDGIVGLFHGIGARGRVLNAATDDVGNVRNPTVDIVSVKLVDNGSTVIASATMAADIPERVSSGSLDYRFYLDFGTGSTSHSRPGSKLATCRLEISVGAAGRTAEGCGFVPRAVGYTVQGPMLEIPVSKTLWPDNQAVSWRMTAHWRGPDESEYDRIYGEPVNLDGSSDRDLSSRTETVAGNVFEVFHYPSIHTNTNYVLPYIYEQVPPDDELAVLFTDFRFDDIFATGPASGPINVPIQGIGDKQTRPRSGSTHRSDNLLSAVSASFIGAPRWAESGVDDAYEFHGHSYGVRHVAHELVHRWSSNLEFRNPQSRNTETLTNGRSSHWSNWLHAPERYPVWSGFANEPYSTASVMGGSIWQDNGDGTFTEQDKGYPRAMGLSDLDLYAMGMIPPEEVRPTFLLRDAVKTGTRGVFRATKVPVRIEDIVAALGPRVPSASEQRKVFRLGVYLLHEDGRPPRAQWLARAQSVTENVVKYFRLATGGSMDTNRPSAATVSGDTSPIETKTTGNAPFDVIFGGK